MRRTRRKQRNYEAFLTFEGRGGLNPSPLPSNALRIKKSLATFIALHFLRVKKSLRFTAPIAIAL